MNKLLPTLERTLSLLIVFLLLAGTVIWTGRLFGHDFGTNSAASDVATVAPAPNDAERQQLGVANYQLIAADSAAWTVMGTDTVGTVVATAPYAAEAFGYAGPTPLYLFIARDGTIRGAVATANNETPDFFNRARDSIFAQVIGKNVSAIVNAKIDAATGATYSSSSLTENVKRTLTARAQTKAEAAKAPVIGWGRTLAVAAVLAFGIVAAWKLRGKRLVRLAILLLNVAVLGFWCGQFLSISLVRGWIQNGVDPVLYLPSILMLLVAIAMPYFGRSHHYCQWVCPFGSVQELAWRLPGPKLQVSQAAFKVMRLVRLTALMLLMLLLWFGLCVDVLDLEPFSAFLLSAAPLGACILAGIVVVASVFVPRPWCRCLCPVGTLLDLASDCEKTKEAKAPQTEMPNEVPSAPTTPTDPSAPTKPTTSASPTISPTSTTNPAVPTDPTSTPTTPTKP